MLSNLKVLVREISFVKICYRLNYSDLLQNTLKQYLMSFSIGYRNRKRLVRKRKLALKSESVGTHYEVSEVRKSKSI